MIEASLKLVAFGFRRFFKDRYSTEDTLPAVAHIYGFIEVYEAVLGYYLL